MLTVLKLLDKKEFISVATCGLDCRPNAAPKMILNVEKKVIYLADYTAGKTLENLRVNPRISLSFSDTEELKGYKINGTVEILENETISEELMEKMEDKKISLSVKRVISGVRNKKQHADFEIGIPQKFVIYKVTVDELTEIGLQGDLQRKAVDAE